MAVLSQYWRFLRLMRTRSLVSLSCLATLEVNYDVLRKLTLVVNCFIYWNLNKTIVIGTEERAPLQEESIFQD